MSQSATGPFTSTPLSQVAAQVAQLLASVPGLTPLVIQAIEGRIGQPNGVAGLSGTGGLMLGGVEAFYVDPNGNIFLTIPLKTVDPQISGALYNQNGLVAISQVLGS